MSLRIEIFLPDDSVSKGSLNEHMEALGFARGGTLATAMASTALTAVSAGIASGETTADTAKPATRKRAATKKEEPATETVEETAETQEQDAADEASEVEEERDQKAPLTVDDVKEAVGLYVQKFGMPAVQEDGVKLFNAVLGAPPAGEKFWKMTILPTDQPTLAKVIAAWKAAAAADQRYGA